MKNHRLEINDKILREFDDLVKESGISRQEFLNYVAEVYNINNNLEKDIIDYNAYYESFTA
jgi:ACT domain-containing protein